jgi:hypothetical protein
MSDVLRRSAEGKIAANQEGDSPALKRAEKAKADKLEKFLTEIEGEIDKSTKEGRKNLSLRPELTSNKNAASRVKDVEADLAQARAQSSSSRERAELSADSTHPDFGVVTEGITKREWLASTDLNVRDLWGRTKLHRACEVGDVRWAMKLIEEGADVEARDKLGSTPLHLAAQEGNSELIMTLILKGHADINAKDEFDLPPIHFAVTYDHREASNLLLDEGADPSILRGMGKWAWLKRGTRNQGDEEVRSSREILSSLNDIQKENDKPPPSSSQTASREVDQLGEPEVVSEDVEVGKSNSNPVSTPGTGIGISVHTPTRR